MPLVYVAAERLSRRGRRFLKRIQRADTAYELQEVATEIQVEVERRSITLDEATHLGNQIHRYNDEFDSSTQVYALSDRDSYRKSLDIYLEDGVLTATEQLLLWDERRKFGISDKEHVELLSIMVSKRKAKGKYTRISDFQLPGGND